MALFIVFVWLEISAPYCFDCSQTSPLFLQSNVLFCLVLFSIVTLFWCAVVVSKLYLFELYLPLKIKWKNLCVKRQKCTIAIFKWKCKTYTRWETMASWNEEEGRPITNLLEYRNCDFNQIYSNFSCNHDPGCLIAKG